jgi:hypothetical protein
MPAAWKKNIRKVPPAIIDRLRRFHDAQIVVAVVKKIPLSAIAAGTHKHLRITAQDATPTIPDFRVPPSRQGKFSHRNVRGWEVVRKDLPKETRTYSFESPNWGDWSNGSHEVEWSRPVYRRDFHAPPELAIHMELLDTEPGSDPCFIIKFQVADALNQSHPEFRDLLFFNLNLLQENVGACDVFKADADLPDFLQTITVEWEILPPGDRAGNLARILSGRPPDEASTAVTERYDTLAALRPLSFIHGRSGFRRYFGAKFAEDLVVFENIEYGNAAYVMFERWETLSQKSRLDLLSRPADGFERVVHRSGWKGQLKGIIQKHRQGQVTKKRK